ncbi:MAG: hypothetical protein M0Z53_11215 [Thermaerobacter sp.]|nr:hypothetical protein [Thermaerobacter sp.]
MKQLTPHDGKVPGPAMGWGALFVMAQDGFGWDDTLEEELEHGRGAEAREPSLACRALWD